MRVLVQRVLASSVEVEGHSIAAIGQGLLVLLGITASDQKEDADWLVQKLLAMRIFSDDAGKMNLDVQQVGGEILVVSQFTLFASTKKGNRPSFIAAAHPERAVSLYDYFVSEMEKVLGQRVQKGQFGADMKVSLVNDGPVTIWMDSRQRE